MPGRVQEDPPPVGTGLEGGNGRPQGDEPGLRLLEVVDVDVEVQLLRDVPTGPGRGPVTLDALEPEEETGPGGPPDEPRELAVRTLVEREAGGPVARW